MAWEKVKLGELYEVHNGLSKGGKFFGSGFPFLSFSTVFNNWFIPKEIKDLVQSTEKEQESYSIKEGDVFITRTSETADELGMSCVALKDYPQATYNGFCKRLRPIQSKYEVSPRYIGYYLRTSFFRGKFLGLSGTMTTRASLRNEDLLAMEIPLPSMKIQKQIAGILSAYDDLIENNQKQIKLLEEAAQRLYKQWFIDFKFPGHETTKIVDGLPEGWNLRSVNTVVDFLSGYAFKSGSFVDAGKYKIVTIKNVQDGIFDGNNVSTIEEIPSKMPSHCVLNEGDILLSLTGNVGRVCLVIGDDYLLNQRVAKLKSHYHAYTYCFFRSKDMFDEMNNLANGAAQQNLSPVRTGEIKVRVPLKSVLDRFESIAEPIIQQIVVLNKQIVCLKQSRDRLLPKLMNNEIEV